MPVEEQTQEEQTTTPEQTTEETTTEEPVPEQTTEETTTEEPVPETKEETTTEEPVPETTEETKEETTTEETTEEESVSETKEETTEEESVSETKEETPTEDTSEDTSEVKLSEIEIPDLSSSIESLTEELLKKIEETGESLSENSLMNIVLYSMEIVESHSLNGSAKKRYVQDMIRRVATGTNELDSDTTAMIYRLIDNGLVENAINMVISASKGEFNINTIKEEAIEVAEEVIEETATGCLMTCLKALKKRRQNKQS